MALDGLQVKKDKGQELAKNTRASSSFSHAASCTASRTDDAQIAAQPAARCTASCTANSLVHHLLMWHVKQRTATLRQLRFGMQKNQEASQKGETSEKGLQLKQGPICYEQGQSPREARRAYVTHRRSQKLHAKCHGMKASMGPKTCSWLEANEKSLPALQVIVSAPTTRLPVTPSAESRSSKGSWSGSCCATRSRAPPLPWAWPWPWAPYAFSCHT